MSEQLQRFICHCTCAVGAFHCERCGIPAVPVYDSEEANERPNLSRKDTYVSKAILECLRSWKRQHDERFTAKGFAPQLWYVADCDLLQLEEWAEHLGRVWDRTEVHPIGQPSGEH
jgi:hypothetical protein